MKEQTIWDKVSQYFDALRARPVHPELGCTSWERDECHVLSEILAHKGEGRIFTARRAYSAAAYHTSLAHGWDCSRQRDLAQKWEEWGDVLAGRKPCPTPESLRFRAVADW